MTFSRRFVIAAAGIGVFLLLIQFRHWITFNWQIFYSALLQIQLWRVLVAIVIFDTGYLFRAWRWKIMLEPVRRTRTSLLISPQFIGFASTALLGRPGELVRPYVIARRENLSFSSQIGVLAIERLFDLGAFSLLVISTLIIASELRSLPYFHALVRAAVIMLAVGTLLIFIAFAIWRWGHGLAPSLERTLNHAFPSPASRISARFEAFRRGLYTIQNFGSFVQLTLISLIIWTTTAFAYWEVAKAFPAPLNQFPLSYIMMLMAFNSLGGIVQIPVVGGGAQVMTISALVHVFSVQPEVAVSMGIMFWVVAFLGVTPVGLIMMRIERLSIFGIAGSDLKSARI